MSVNSSMILAGLAFRLSPKSTNGAHVAWIPFGFSVLEPADTLSLGLGSWVCSPAFSMYQPARNVFVSSGTKNMRTLRLHAGQLVHTQRPDPVWNCAIPLLSPWVPTHFQLLSSHV